MAKIDSVYDFTEKGLVELKSWLEPWFRTRERFPAAPTGGETLDEKILAALPEGFWKLNESSGHIAADSSGHGQDLSTHTPELDPLWGYPPGPPGQQTANFDNGTGGLGGTAARVSRSWAPLTGDFTAAIWVNRTTDDGVQVFGQGNPGRSGGTGWQLNISSRAFVPTNVPWAEMAGSATSVFAVNPLLPGTWAMVAIVYDHTATQFKLYVNGLLEGVSDPFTYVPVATSSPLWIGHDGGLGSYAISPGHFAGSYAFLVNRVMSGAELSDLTAAAGTPPITDHTGWTLTVGADGQPEWQEPGVSVEHGDGTPDPTPVVHPSSPYAGTPTSVSGWHLQAHSETAVLYDSTPGRFDVPSMKWVRVPFNTVRIWRSWEPTVDTDHPVDAWLADDRGLTSQARNGILSIAAGMEGTPSVLEGSHGVGGWFSPEWPILDFRLLPDNDDPYHDHPELAFPDSYARAGRFVDVSHGLVLRAGPGSANPTYRRFFEWLFPSSAADTAEWVDAPTDNPYPIYPVWSARPLVLPGPYPKLSEADSGAYYAPQKTFVLNANLSVGDNICLQVWQDSPWLVRFSTDTYRIPYPGLVPHYQIRPYLAVSYFYDPETINHTTGVVL